MSRACWGLLVAVLEAHDPELNRGGMHGIMLRLVERRMKALEAVA